MSLAAKALRHLIEIGDRYVDHIADIVWYMLPNILLSCELYTGTLTPELYKYISKFFIDSLSLASYLQDKCGIII